MTTEALIADGHICFRAAKARPALTRFSILAINHLGLAPAWKALTPRGAANLPATRLTKIFYYKFIALDQPMTGKPGQHPTTLLQPRTALFPTLLLIRPPSENTAVLTTG